jgi:hypothetical protein
MKKRPVEAGSPVLEKLAAEIRRRFPELRTQVSFSSWQSTWKPKGLRYITRVGPMRYGYSLSVWDETGRRIEDWNTADPATSVRRSVEEWMRIRAIDQGKP